MKAYQSIIQLNMKTFFCIICLSVCLNLFGQTDVKHVIYNRSNYDIISWIVTHDDVSDSHNMIMRNHFTRKYTEYSNYSLLNCIYDAEFYEFSKNCCVEYLLVLIPKHSKFEYQIHMPKDSAEVVMPRIVSFRRSTVEEYLKVKLADRWLYSKKKIEINLDSGGTMTIVK